jgi:hypothetical protein
MITVTAYNLDNLLDQIGLLLEKRDRNAPSPSPEPSSMVLDGFLDNLDGNAYRASEDGKVSFRIFDAKEPHGSLKVEVSQQLYSEIRKLGLNASTQRMRVTIEVLP